MGTTLIAVGDLGVGEVKPMLLLVIIASSALSVALVALARLTQNRHKMRGTDDVETAYVTAIATLYGIFIAFMIFTVWSRYDEADMSIAVEADNVGAIYRMAGGLPDPLRTEMRNLCLQYVHSVVDNEWDTMQYGRESPATEAVLRKMWGLYDGMAGTVSDSVLRDHMLTAFTTMAERRRMRLLWSNKGLSPYAYVVLFVGALVTIGLAALFTVESFSVHVVKVMSLAAIIALMLATVWALGHPFRGALRLKPDSFELLLRLARNERHL